jgi:hypothetical protein
MLQPFLVSDGSGARRHRLIAADINLESKVPTARVQIVR